MKLRTIARGGVVVAASLALGSFGAGMGQRATALTSTKLPKATATVVSLRNPYPGGFWSSTPPQSGGRMPSNAVRLQMVPLYTNDLGCSGIPEGSQGDPYWYCRASAENQLLGQVISVRVGAYNNSNYPGLEFGWSKFFYKHNVYLQTVLNAIVQSTPASSDPSRLETLNDYYYSDGQFIEAFRTIVNETDLVGTYSMQGTGPVGVQTAYCYLPNGEKQNLCPSWVNTTLG